MKNLFKAGDFVISKVTYKTQFTKGKIYRVSSAKNAAVFLAEDDLGSHTNGWGFDNFILAGNISELEKTLYGF